MGANIVPSVETSSTAGGDIAIDLAKLDQQYAPQSHDLITLPYRGSIPVTAPVYPRAIAAAETPFPAAGTEPMVPRQQEAVGSAPINNGTQDPQPQREVANIDAKRAQARRQAKLAIISVSINLALSTASGLIGGFLLHDANLGVGIGGIVLAVLLAVSAILLLLLQ
ncbi:hypothetical protein VFPPC_09623 [Pochonia chlamydosporia 170]|uniref:Uncharacterized protein n=1 Tax=Pochonia chlamydosporia 170 TaxID=1380566 RepID=A0A179FE01_METCM|nr:hypothetical protein VFPPC_09623 [Pochonia chlamydosporia 170]OAQ63722.1 hypothetical protein VFPPC_09623 [Pochonia chlamydosporia 170]